MSEPIGPVMWVLAHSPATGSDRLVLIAIAAHADPDGTNSYPSNARLMAYTKLSERGVWVALSRLRKSGQITVDLKAGPQFTNRYTVVMSTPAPNAGVHGVHPARGAPPLHDMQDDKPARNGTTETETAPSPPAESAPNLKDLKTKNLRTKYTSRPDVDALCDYLADLIETNGSKRPTIGDNWRTACRLMLDTDKLTPEQIRKAIAFSQRDEFWRGNILSMRSLRKHYDTLRLQAQRGNGHRQVPVTPYATPIEPGRVNPTW